MNDNTNSQDLIALLRTFIGDTQIVRAARGAADVMEQQAARIAELEARFDTQGSAPVAWANVREDGVIVALSQHPEDIDRWINPRPLVFSESASVDAIRREALEEAAEAIEGMNDSAGDRASYDNREMTCCELSSMSSLSAAAAHIRALAASEPKNTGN